MRGGAWEFESYSVLAAQERFSPHRPVACANAVAQAHLEGAAATLGPQAALALEAVRAKDVCSSFDLATWGLQ